MRASAVPTGQRASGNRPNSDTWEAAADFRHLADGLQLTCKSAVIPTIRSKWPNTSPKRKCLLI